MRVVPVPALLKDSAGAYRNAGMSVQQALAARSAAFRAAVDEVRPTWWSSTATRTARPAS